MVKQLCEVVEYTQTHVKSLPNSPILMISHELNNIEVNKRRIHGDLRYFFMYLLNLIKSDDKMRLEIRDFDIFGKRT